MPDIKFKLGRVVGTPGALQALKANAKSPMEYIGKHQRGEWGELCEEDKRLNDEAVANEGNRDKQQRVLSAYRLPDKTRIWIITEWDRSATTILLPEEY